MITIKPIPAFTDNYIWMLTNTAKKIAIVVDPGDSKPVIDELQQQQLTLAAILVTHHHYDHTGGVNALVQQFNIPVYGPKYEAKPLVSVPLVENDRINFDEFGLTFDIIDIPGHTKGHIAFYSKSNILATPVVFCGDTLFSAGCGRLFEGSAEQMYHSLCKLAALPANTAIYCAHEYTLSNLKFAQQVEANNPQLEQRLQLVKTLRDNNLVTLPSSLQVELATNPFLRCKQQQIKASAESYSGQQLSTPEQVFAVIRAWKDIAPAIN